MTPFRLDGKVALVTGGTGGIGEAVCRSLAEAGAKVAVGGRNPEKAAAVAASIRALGGVAQPAVFNVLSVADTQSGIDEVAGRFGGIDILVNSVGLNREQTALDFTEDAFDYILDVNLKGAMFQAQATARHMIRRGLGGKQVHVGSVRSQVALRGRGYAAYCASKGGLSALCKQLAAEWAQHRINVNVVAPTFTRTQMVASMIDDAAVYSAFIERIPLGRIAEPAEVGYVVLFFASSASDFITGQTLYMDGGITASQ